MSDPKAFPAAALGPLPAQPLVSVVIPAYNAERFVLDALRSVLAQDYAPLEILLVDDGSQDGTVALVEREAPSVRIIRQANAGAAAARNTGLREARGDLVCLLDADDGWFPGKLAAQVEHLRLHPEVGLVFHHWLVWQPREDGSYAPPALPATRPAGIDADCSGWIYSRLLLDCIVHTSTVMMRREVVAATGFFDTTLINGEDYNYWLRVSRNYPIHKLAAVYSYYREVPGSLTKLSKPKAENYEYRVVSGAIERWGLASPDGSAISPAEAARRLGRLAFDFGYGHFLGGSPRLARRALLQTLRYGPRRLKAALFLLALALGWQHWGRKAPSS